MSYNKNDFNIQNKNEHNFDLKLYQKYNFDLKLNNIHNFDLLNVFGFATSRSIYVKIRFAINSIASFLLKSKIHSIIKSNIKTIVHFKMIKKYTVEINQTIKTKITFLAKKKIYGTSKSGFRIGKITILDMLDKFTFAEIDNKTLSQLGFTEGVFLKIKKKILGKSKFAIATTINLNKYRYGKFLDYDNLTFSDLDSKTFSELDRTLIN